MSEAPVLVLGAGCAGLSAAYRLQSKGRTVVVLEADDHPGGLAGGVRIGGNVYEYGPHVFHTTDPEILEDVKGLMGKDLLPFHRTVQIRFLGNYFQFPLSMGEVLGNLPVTTVLWAAVTFLYRFILGAFVKPPVENSETVLLRYYGDVLYRIFFKDYIIRVWGVPPAEFSPSFARERIPRLDFLEILEKLHAKARGSLGLGAPVKTAGYVEKVEGELYTTVRGFSMITDRMADRLREKGGEVRLKTTATKILREGKRVTGVLAQSQGREESISASAVVNTLPINEAALAFEPALDEKTVAAAQKLRFRAIVFVGLKVRRPRVLPASFMYFREHSFNRITDLAHFGFEITPKGSTLLVAEVTCYPGERLWTDEDFVKEAVIADLEREKILSRGEIEESHVFRARHAHPMYTMGYEDALKTVLDAFAGLENFETAGRQGRFQYVNTHIAMKMGYEAADRLLKK